MKKILTYFLVVGTIYTAVYLIYSFINWSIENPFQWVLNLPAYSDDIRAAIFFSWLSSQAITIPITREVYAKLFKPKTNEP